MMMLVMFQEVAQTAAAAAKQAVETNVPHGITQLQTQIGAAAVSAYMLRMLQKAKSLPWITAHSDSINTAVRLGMSAVATIGVNWQWNGDDHSLVIRGLSLAAMSAGAWHCFQQYALTHMSGGAINMAQSAFDVGKKEPS